MKETNVQTTLLPSGCQFNVDVINVLKDIRARKIHVSFMDADSPDRFSVGGSGKDPSVFSLRYEEAESLMRALWQEGVKPELAQQELQAKNAELAAVNRHLADLQRYLDHHLGLPVR